MIDKVNNAIESAVTNLGYEIVEITYGKKYDDFVLEVFIEKSGGGINLDDCEKVHHLIDPILDQLDPTNGAPYVLNVSSSGLDRRFKTERDFIRNYGQQVYVKLIKPINKKYAIEGILQNKDNNAITVLCDNAEQTIQLNAIKYIHKLIKF